MGSGGGKPVSEPAPVILRLGCGPLRLISPYIQLQFRSLDGVGVSVIGVIKSCLELGAKHKTQLKRTYYQDSLKDLHSESLLLC